MASPLPAPSSLRVVSLCQGATDVICALGLQHCLVGRSHECTGPASVLALPCVSCNAGLPSGDHRDDDHDDDKKSLAGYNFNWELLQELNPDLIFIQNHVQASDDRLATCATQQLYWAAGRNCRVIALHAHTIEDIFQNFQTVAELCGVKKEGAKLVAGLRSQWKVLKQKTPQWADGMPRVTVACLLSVNPLIGAGYWVPEVISCAGGLSVCGRAGCPGTHLTTGDLMEKNPDVILLLRQGEMHIESLASEFSWFSSSREWQQLRAVKANRLFVADADRVFIDSGTNVVYTAEMLVELLHGFKFGHEGRCFLRWQSLSIEKGRNNSRSLASSKTSPDLNHRTVSKRDILEGRGGSTSLLLKQNVHDIHRALTVASTMENTGSDILRHGTNACEIKRTVTANEEDGRCENPKPDLVGGASGVVEVEQINFFDRECCENEKGKTEAYGCFAKMQVPSSTNHGSKQLSPGREDMVLDNCRAKWEKPVQEVLQNIPVNPGSPTQQFCSFHVGNVKESPEEKRTVQVIKHSKFNKEMDFCRYSKQASLDENTLHRNYVVKSIRDKDLIAKIWASTQSAAEARSYSSPSSSKVRLLDKLKSVPASAGTFVAKSLTSDAFPSDEEGTLGKLSTSRQQNILSCKSNNPKRISHGSRCGESKTVNLKSSLSMPLKGGCGQSRESQLLASGTYIRRCSSEKVSSKEHCGNLLTLDRLPRKARAIRDLVIDSIRDIKSADCLLLSGGLASSILAEAAVLAYSSGFKCGVTVVAGSAATDRTFAEAVAKRNKMEHAVIGDLKKETPVTLLARELVFVVETLRTFDPFLIRNCVPIVAALREAKRRGFQEVVSGDGTMELFPRLSQEVPSFHFEAYRILQKSVVVLGKALGIKVLQPFLHPKIADYCKSLSLVDMIAHGSGTLVQERSTLRRAFPEVEAISRVKSLIEVGSGVFSVSEYFSSEIPGSVVKNKAKRICQKEGIRICDAEHLVYYRAFRRVFKGKVPKGLVRWRSNPCLGCGYQLSMDMDDYCLVCGHTRHTYDDHVKYDKTKHQQDTLLPSQSCTDLTYTTKGMTEDEPAANETEKTPEGTLELYGKVEASDGSIKPKDGNRRLKSSSERIHPREPQGRSRQLKVPSDLPTTAKRSVDSKPRPIKAEVPNYLAVLGAGSAALLLLLQLLKR